MSIGRWMDKEVVYIYTTEYYSVLLPGKSHGGRSLVGCSPWGREESDMTELHFHFSFSCIGEGNGNPLQFSCLENPRGGGAWWAAVYRVAQSRTRLKWLNSSSSSYKKECIWVSSNEVEETGAYYTEWSKSEREAPIQYIVTYMWNLERW